MGLALMLRVTTDPDCELRFRQIALSNTKNSFTRLGWLDYRLVSVHGDKQTDGWKTRASVSGLPKGGE